MHDVYIIDGRRTPFIKFQGKPNPFFASELALGCAKSLLVAQPFAATDIDEVVTGCVCPAATEANIARIIALRLGCGDKTVAWTVQRNCASGLQAVDSAANDIALGRHDCVLVGGTEAMSKAPLNFKAEFTEWAGSLKTTKSLAKKLTLLKKLKLNYLVPEVSLMKALTDPVVNLSMGSTAEELAYRFGVTRQEMDAYSLASHKKAANAYKSGHFTEVEPLYDWRGDVITKDNGIREDGNLDKLAQLKPVFEKPFGLITAGNSSQITDGASFLLLANDKFVDKHDIKPLAVIRACQWSGLSPEVMGLGPAHSIANLLKSNSLEVDDIDYWEINEAFAAQVLACRKALTDAEYCNLHFNSDAFDLIPEDRLNVDGGAISLGHPVGASGARIVLHLAKTLLRTQGKLGCASLCIGGGQGGAMLIENVAGA